MTYKRRSEMKHIKDKIQVLHAIEMLEYHDKNWLSGDNKSRCEGKLLLLEEAIIEIDMPKEVEGDL